MLSPESVNAWRIIPRLAVAIFLSLLIYLSLWFSKLDNPSNAQAMFISAVWGAGSMFFGFYMNTGNTKKETVQ